VHVIANPVESHVDRVGPFLIDSVIDNTRSGAVLVWWRVGDGNSVMGSANFTCIVDVGESTTLRGGPVVVGGICIEGASSTAVGGGVAQCRFGSDAG
jgi:hypothetical protein